MNKCEEKELGSISTLKSGKFVSSSEIHELSPQYTYPCRTSMEEFLAGGKLEVVIYDKADLPDVVVERAAKRMGESGYNLIFNNCEHFARYCKTGEAKSEQVKDASAVTGGTVTTGAGTYAGIAIVSTAGSVAGLSGPGVMSGLAAIGPGGAVGGVATLAVIPAIATNLAVNTILKDYAALPSSEREARSLGRAAAKVGTVAGAAGSVAGISAAGSVAGLSGAGITSGLAAIGGTVGGGMVTGTAIAIAAPTAAAAAVGLGAYKLYQWLKK